MTSPLRRKRRITARGPSTPARTAPSLAALLLVLAAGAAPAQQAPKPPGFLPDLGQPPPVLRGTPKPPGPSPLPAFPAVTQLQPTPAAPMEAPLWRAAFEADGVPNVSETAPYPIQLEPPDIERVALSLQSDEALRERIRQEQRERTPPERVVFPESPVLTTETYHGRSWEPSKLVVEPYYVIHRKLYFQQPNFERYGWDLGPITPVLESLAFLSDFVTFPYQVGTDPFRIMDSGAGYCLPGDPVPLLLYPPELSLTGALTEALTVVGLVALFP